ncbi:MAG TPA: L-seryl-tRNA(Sec) selenium transferase [Anaerolineales bacterium]|nr:L-seryl-tRNA(Sec) selenium transferase [Anaerolineales bacterium]
MEGLRSLPSIDKLLQQSRSDSLISIFGRPLVVRALREILNTIRLEYHPSTAKAIPSDNSILDQAESLLFKYTQTSLKPVINATGVVLHTNLGRALLSKEAMDAMLSVGGNYSTLEFDPTTGKRGSRLVHAEDILRTLLGVEAALVVNNNASAVLLVLSALAYRRKVIIPRSQLVEIGGGFRVPDVMKQSGAKLVEIGTTNQVHLSDYQEALQEPTAIVMRAHRSNFQIIGFTSEPTIREIIDTTHQAGVLFMDDLGSGALLNTDHYGLAHEPTVQESLEDGADLVCFSGDKLLGGPQAGIIVGKKNLIARIQKHPLARAVRADKFCLAALSATLLHYLKDEAEEKIPTWQMISVKEEALKSRVEGWIKIIGQGEIMKGTSTIGGGSLPGETLDTWLLGLEGNNPDQFLDRLRSQEPAIIGRIENDMILLDPRTVPMEQEKYFLDGLLKSLQKK